MLIDRLRRTFIPAKLRRAFNKTFGGPDGKLVLSWIMDVTHATETTARATEAETNRAIGRREVWLAMNDVLTLSESDIRDMQENVANTGDFDDE